MTMTAMSTIMIIQAMTLLSMAGMWYKKRWRKRQRLQVWGQTERDLGIIMKKTVQHAKKRYNTLPDKQQKEQRGLVQDDKVSW